jgi:hypothetical protein
LKKAKEKKAVELDTELDVEDLKKWFLILNLYVKLKLVKNFPKTLGPTLGKYYCRI